MCKFTFRRHDLTFLRVIEVSVNRTLKQFPVVKFVLCVMCDAIYMMLIGNVRAENFANFLAFSGWKRRGLCSFVHLI